MGGKNKKNVVPGTNYIIIQVTVSPFVSNQTYANKE